MCVARAETAKQRLRDEEKSRQSLNNLDKAAMEKCEPAPHALMRACTRSLSATPARRRLARRPGAKLEPSDSHSVPVRSDGQAVEMASYKVRCGVRARERPPWLSALAARRASRPQLAM